MIHSMTYSSVTKERVRGRGFFLGAFISACFLFWWLPSILFRAFVHQADAVENGTIAISVLALLFFVAGYLFPSADRPARLFPEAVTGACEDIAYKATVFIFVPALLMALQHWRSSLGIRYGDGMGDPIPRLYQIALYTHMFFGFLCIGASNPEKQGSRRILIAWILITLPRLIISLNGARFFVAQAIIPALFIAVGRGWIRLSLKRMIQFVALAVALIFLPALTRGDRLVGQAEVVKFIAAGSSLNLYQENTDINLSGRCPPFIVSLTAKVIPYSALGVCVIDVFGLKNLPATLGRILTYNSPGYTPDLLTGTGSNYLLELYVSGGIFAVFAGSALFGYSCVRFVGWIGRRSLFSGIWALCLTRALFAPRSDLSYVYEWIPLMALETYLVVLVVLASRVLKSEYAADFRLYQTKGEKLNDR